MSSIRSGSSPIRPYLRLLAQRRFVAMTAAAGAVCCVMIDVAGDVNKYGTHTVILFTALSVLSLMSMVPFPRIGAILTMLVALVIDIGPSDWVNSFLGAVLIVCASLTLGHNESSHRWGFYFVTSVCVIMTALATILTTRGNSKSCAAHPIRIGKNNNALGRATAQHGTGSADS